MSKINPVQIAPVNTVEELRLVTVKKLNELAQQNATKSSRRTDPIDMGNQRITSLSQPADGADAATKAYVDRALADLRAELISGASPKAQGPVQGGAGGVLLGSFASKPAPGSQPAGTFYFATDRNELYVVFGGAWVQVSQQTDADFKPSADGTISLGSTALRFLNAFVKSGLNVGGASAPRYLAEFLGGSVAQIHLASADTDNGGWLQAVAAGSIFFSLGAFSNGVNWTAKSANAAIFGVADNGNLSFFYDTTLNITPGIGGTYNPTLRFRVDASGNITTVAAITATGTVTAPTVNATTNFQANGTAGVTFGPSAITTLTVKNGIVTAHT